MTPADWLATGLALGVGGVVLAAIMLVDRVTR